MNQASPSLSVTIPGRASRRDGRRLVLLGGWFVVLIATFLIWGVSTPKQIREANAPGHSQVDDPERLASALARIGLTSRDLVIIQGSLGLVAACLSFVISFLLIRRRAPNWFVYTLSLNLVAGLGAMYPPDQAENLGHRLFLIGVARLVTLLAIGFLFLLPFYFPDGRLVSRWFAIPVAMVGASALPFILFPNHSFSDPATLIPHGSIIWAFFVTGSAIVSLTLRFRRSQGLAARQQMKWAGFGVICGLALFLGGDWMMNHINGTNGGIAALIGFTFAMPLATAVVPLSIGVAMLNYRLFDIDAFISRSLLSVVMTGLVILTYAGVVLGFGRALDQQNHLWLSIVGTGLVAVAFQPVRVQIQRGIDRVLFGQRDDPYAVLAQLAVQLEATQPKDDMIPAIVVTLMETLRLPYAAIALDSGGQRFVVAASGIEPATVERFPLIHQSLRIGDLIVGPREPGGELGAGDRRLLEDLARQIGVAVRGVQLTADLLRSRERLVMGREEERRRLRRDVHDGLGGQLAALSMQAGSLRHLIRSDPDAAETQAVELRGELKAAVAEIRRVVLGLRPPALDELGLIGAIDERAQRLHNASLEILIAAPPSLPPLPAAIEVAAFRIVEEALTNAVKHSSATRCDITIACGDGLTIHIADNGIGLPAAPSLGVGLGSMRERAEELGGRCTIGANADGPGTRVQLVLPLTMHRVPPDA